MAKSPINIDLNSGIRYLDRPVSLPQKKENYSTTEISQLLNCCYETVRSLILNKKLVAKLDERNRYVISHNNLVKFLEEGSNGIHRDIEDALFEGLEKPSKLARVLHCETMNIDDRIRRHGFPYINISSADKPYYRLPRKETKRQLTLLKKIV